MSLLEKRFLCIPRLFGKSNPQIWMIIYRKFFSQLLYWERLLAHFMYHADSLCKCCRGKNMPGFIALRAWNSRMDWKNHQNCSIHFSLQLLNKFWARNSFFTQRKALAKKTITFQFKNKFDLDNFIKITLLKSLCLKRIQNFPWDKEALRSASEGLIELRNWPDLIKKPPTLWNLTCCWTEMFQVCLILLCRNIYNKDFGRFNEFFK